jgi:hypothetical protein
MAFPHPVARPRIRPTPRPMVATNVPGKNRVVFALLWVVGPVVITWSTWSLTTPYERRGAVQKRRTSRRRAGLRSDDWRGWRDRGSARRA